MNGAEVMSENGRRLGEEKDGTKVIYAKEPYTRIHAYTKVRL